MLFDFVAVSFHEACALERPGLQSQSRTNPVRRFKCPIHEGRRGPIARSVKEGQEGTSYLTDV